MASHTHNAQVERLEVVDTGRRRRWSEEEKLRIVAESLSGPRLVSATNFSRTYWITFHCRGIDSSVSVIVSPSLRSRLPPHDRAQS
jgi:hypothetical protein